MTVGFLKEESRLAFYIVEGTGRTVAVVLDPPPKVDDIGLRAPRSLA